MPFGQLETTLAQDTILTAAPLERLLRHALILPFTGESHRLKRQRQAGMIWRSDVA